MIDDIQPLHDNSHVLLYALAGYNRWFPAYKSACFHVHTHEREIGMSGHDIYGYMHACFLVQPDGFQVLA